VTPKTGFKVTVFFEDEYLKNGATSHQVRRARLFSRWSVCMEQTTRRHLRGTWHHQLSKNFLKLTILILRLTFN